MQTDFTKKVLIPACRIASSRDSPSPGSSSNSPLRNCDVTSDMWTRLKEHCQQSLVGFPTNTSTDVRLPILMHSTIYVSYLKRTLVHRHFPSCLQVLLLHQEHHTATCTVPTLLLTLRQCVSLPAYLHHWPSSLGHICGRDHEWMKTCHVIKVTNP